jgi:hypothetical protein
MEIGHDVFCPGAYTANENADALNLRPGLKRCNNFDSLMEEWHKLGKPGIDNKECLTVEFVKKFDAVIIMHLPLWVHINWPVFKAANIPIIWRTIGQSIAGNEREMSKYRDQGMEIIRYSPRERSIPGYIGEDVLIRFSKDPEEFKDWNGHIKEVMTIGQHMERREPATNFNWFKEVTEDTPRRLFGPGSESLSFGMGKLPYPALKVAMQDYRAYFYTGTWPASYTLNFMEAMMTGMPMVCIGPKKGHPHGWFPGHDLYEIPDIIQNDVNGYFSNDKMELQSIMAELINNDRLANRVSEAGRLTAVNLFGKETVKLAWKNYLNSLKC